MTTVALIWLLAIVLAATSLAVKEPLGTDSQSVKRIVSRQISYPHQEPLGTDSQSAKRIVSGQISDPHQWPWQAQLLLFHNLTWVHFCGGSLIDPEWVITAAHCVFGNDKSLLKVKLGEHDIALIDPLHETEHSITQIHIHEHFSMVVPISDIAVLKISPPARITKQVQMIGLPKLYYKVPLGTICVAKGWGDTHKNQLGQGSRMLRHVELPVVSHEVCAARNGIYFQVHLFSNICAGSQCSPGRGCYGDSGGGLVCMNAKGDWALQGLLSWGDRYCTQKYYSVFTRVSSFTDWIQWKIGKALAPQKGYVLL